MQMTTPASNLGPIPPVVGVVGSPFTRLPVRRGYDGRYPLPGRAFRRTVSGRASITWALLCPEKAIGSSLRPRYAFSLVLFAPGVLEDFVLGPPKRANGRFSPLGLCLGCIK